MATKSNIQWTDATWNIARGCTKVDEDCKFCYMYRESLNGTRYEPKHVTRTKTVFNLPLKLKEPSRIFTSSLTDWAHPEIDSYRHEMFDIINRCPHHTFQLLTKRPERLQEILPPNGFGSYKNVWSGTSIGSQKSIERAWRLLDTFSHTYFLSLEPLWGQVDLNDAELLHKDWRNRFTIGRYIDWVIVGGESGNENGMYRYRECKLEWIESIVSQCKAAGVPVFVKQLGTHLAKQLKLSDRHGGNMDEWPEYLRIRQFPNV